MKNFEGTFLICGNTFTCLEKPNPKAEQRISQYLFEIANVSTEQLCKC